MTALLLAVVGDVATAGSAFANYSNDGSTHCRDWNAGYPNSSLVVYGWKLSPCISVDSAGQARLTVGYVVGSTDVRLHARLLSIVNGVATPVSAWQDSQTAVGLNVAQGTQDTYDFGSMPVPTVPGSYVVEATLTESGVSYGWLESPVVDVNRPAPVVNRPVAPDGQTSCKDQWGSDYNWLYLDSRDSGWAPVSGDAHDYASLSQPGEAFYSAFQSGLSGQSIDYWTNPYPAVGIGLRKGETRWDLINLLSGGYGQSVYDGKYGSDGNHGLRAEINYIRNTCPSTKILLGGYSQGAQVAGDVYDDRAGSGITGMVLFGDPHFYGKGAGDQGVDYDPATNGILNPIRGDFANGNANVMSFCNAKDPVCQGLPTSVDQISVNAHANYLDKSYPQIAANYFLGHGSRLSPPSTAPTGRFSSFAVNGQSGTEVTVTGAAQLTSFTSGAATVTYYLDPQVDHSKSLGSSASADHAISFDTMSRFSPVPIGHHLIGAVATVNGVQVDEQRIPVWIQDTTLDQFSINNNQADYQTVAGTIGLSAIARAADWVMYYYDDADPVGSGYLHAVPNWPAGGAQYHADTFDTTILSNGPHTITAVAFESYVTNAQVVTRQWLNVKTLHINVQNNAVATFASPGFQFYGTNCSYASCGSDHYAQGDVLALTAHEHLATWVEYFANNTSPVNYQSPGELRDARSGGEPLGGDPQAGPTDHLLYVDLSQLPLGWNTLTAAAFGPYGTVVSTESISFFVYKGPMGGHPALGLIQSGSLAQFGQTTTGGPLIRNTAAPATPTGARDAATANSSVTVPASGVTLTQVIENDGLLHQVGQQTDGTWKDTAAVNRSGQTIQATAVSSCYDTTLGAVVAEVIGTDGAVSHLVQQPDGSWSQTAVADSTGTSVHAAALSVAYEPDHDAVLVQVAESDGLLHQLALQRDGSWTDVKVLTGAMTVPAKQVSSAYEFAKASLVSQVIETDGLLHQLVQAGNGSWTDTSQGIVAKTVETSYKDSDGSLTSEVVESDGQVHQVVQKSDGSTSDAPAVTDTGSHISLIPVAVLGVKPNPGVPDGVVADASGSKATGAAIVGYTFDFGDGTVVGPQPSPKATHIYGSAGAYTVKVTVGDAVGLSATTTASASAVATPVAAGYVQRLGGEAVKSTGTSVVVPVGAATATGDALVVTALLTSTTSLTGAVTATDSQGNAYSVVTDVNDGAAKDRLLTLAAFGTKPLGTADTVTLTFPSSQEHHVTVDEYTGVKAADQSASRYDTAEATFNSGPTAQTGSDGELVVGTVATEGGDAPQLTGGFAALPIQQVGNDSLLSGYMSGQAAGVFRASGQVSGPWLAAVTTFVPSGPAVLTAKLAASAGADAMTYTADASTTVIGPSPVSSYTFDFGDGSTVGPQTAPTANHTYAQQGAYTVTVTVKDAAGSTSTASSSVSPAPAPPPPPISYVGRVGAEAVQATTGKVTISPGTATKANDALIVTALLTNSASGSISASDTQGDAFAVVNDTNDGSAKDRLVTLAAFGAKALATSDSITVTFPTATEHHIAVDEYAGIGSADQHVGTNGPAGTVLASGATTQATSDDELVLGTVATEGGTVPTISGDGGYTSLPLQQVASDSLLSAYRVSASGTAGTSGTGTGGWMAQTTTFRAAGGARLTANLTATVSATQPLQVTADASASVAGASAISGYTLDFGDGSPAVAQLGATGTHNYQSAGTYIVKATVTDSAGSSVVAARTVTVAPTPAISYIGRVASDAAAATTTSLSLHPTASVRLGDTLAVSLMLTNVKSGSVTVTDSAGNTYNNVTDTPDGAGDRTLVFVATDIAAMNSAATITVTYPSNTEHHVAVDEFAGITAVDQKAAATGSAATFDSGATPVTTTAHELVLGVAGIQGGNTTTWGSGFTGLPTLLVSQDQLAVGYKVVSATGAYHATGSAQKTWMAEVVTIR